MNDKIKINEIFYSIDGEGMRAGYPAVFIRTAGCNLRCDYCDTGYALSKEAGISMSIEDIEKKVSEYNCKNITLTGGEPLLNKAAKKLIKKLTESGYDVIVETNGSIPIKDITTSCKICMDWKIPSSGMCREMLEENLSQLYAVDCLKMVVRKEDLPYVDKFLNEHTLACPVYISPVFGEINLEEIAEFIKNYHGQNRVKMQVQLHKIIWDPDRRGV